MGFYSGKSVPQKTLPVGVVLTIPAAGSEASKSSVITNEQGWYKRGLNIELIRPVFAIMNPELTFTLSQYQTACGIADIMAHIMERYFTTTPDVELMDRLCEGVLQSIISNAYRILADQMIIMLEHRLCGLQLLLTMIFKYWKNWRLGISSD